MSDEQFLQLHDLANSGVAALWTIAVLLAIVAAIAVVKSVF